jgi:acyl-CoA reductase-like NAD-dependent aldehyde dehydrogenase
MNQNKIDEIAQDQAALFSSGQTLSVPFRIKQLKKLKKTIEDNEESIIKAVQTDLDKPEFEAWYSEIGTVIYELKYVLNHIKKWSSPKKVKVPLVLFGSSCYRYPEPLGRILIIGTWNYPLHTVLYPLIGSIASGNCTVLKPSELAPASSRLCTRLIQNTFAPNYISCIEGSANTTQYLLGTGFDHIFFTGGEKAGRAVMEAASKCLIPVTLELGGKNPVIVEPDISISMAAKKIVWGKFINAGQTCLSPDYVLVNERVKKQLIEEMKKWLLKFYGNDASKNPDYGRIINESHFKRLLGLLKGAKIVSGGKTSMKNRYIAPTIIDDVKPDAKIMKEEIFGPLLPLIKYNNLKEAILYINKKSKPLCMYIFSKNKSSQEKILNNTSAGNVCINDTIIQHAVLSLPFGGVGKSGMGQYHGRASFDCFTNYKSVLKKSNIINSNLIYPPYKNKLAKIKKFV